MFSNHGEIAYTCICLFQFLRGRKLNLNIKSCVKKHSYLQKGIVFCVEGNYMIIQKNRYLCLYCCFEYDLIVEKHKNKAYRLDCHDDESLRY